MLTCKTKYLKWKVGPAVQSMKGLVANGHQGLPCGHQGLPFDHQGLPCGQQGLPCGHQGLSFGNQCLTFILVIW